MTFPEIISQSAVMQEVFHILQRLMTSDASVLIQGESGTGKELIAHVIHRYGPRREKQIVDIDCGAIPGDLLESELFGHIKGAFTGAYTDKVGLLEIASGGVILLDEVANVPLTTQAKLLRTIQEKAVRRLGDHALRGYDAQIIATTNKDLKAEIHAGRFREDLFFRLNVISLQVPPLRRRLEDLPLLLDYLQQRIAQRNKVSPKTFSPAAIKRLQSYAWPGNIRELENVIEQLLILNANNRIEVIDLPTHIIGIESPVVESDALAAHEKAHILKILTKTRWNIRTTAKLLEISRTTLYSKIEKHGLSMRDFREEV